MLLNLNEMFFKMINSKEYSELENVLQETVLNL